MKKAAIILLAVFLLLSLCACGASAPADVPEPAPESTAPPEETESAAPAELPDNEPESEETPEEAPGEAGILYAGTASALQAGYCVLTVRDALQLSTDDSFGPELTWLSSDETVATVEGGLVLPVGAGRAEILFTDGENSGAAIVLVDDAPEEEPKPAGRLMIEKDGTLYESSLPASLWELAGLAEPGCLASDDAAVYEADGSFYVKPEYLLNVLCCCEGEAKVIPAVGDGYPQLCGDAEIRSAEPPVAFDWLGETDRLLTGSVVMEFPDGSFRGGALYTQIVKNDEPVGAVFYHAVGVGEDICPEAEYYFDCFGVPCTLRYDEELRALIVSIQEG